MLWKSITGTLAALALMAGCASHAPDISGADTGAGDTQSATTDTSSNQNTCNSDLAENAVGQKVSPDLVETSRKQAHAKMARALRPNDVITMEYNPQRLNLRVDEQDIVTSVNCS
ncbi:I78 family peptidase inhibitor [Allopusillimonas ginsengisoli]|uniref:I78 family peptidase inhibitor n=1 Tax=Allopusillimonas ginsengisoli TaxID=453575 RepID=UPI0010227947|nr:I78 family peptidase inhibitor [Allopusillimonas ginsengisoli]TEA79034.1 hypothetical protein ERE07_06485 [Allopusillimonas ginsengisoli]